MLEPVLLLLRPNRRPMPDDRDTFVFDCELTLHFTNRSVPEPIRVWHSLGERRFATRAASGEQPAEGRAATTSLTTWLMNLPAVE